MYVRTFLMVVAILTATPVAAQDAPTEATPSTAGAVVTEPVFKTSSMTQYETFETPLWGAGKLVTKVDPKTKHTLVLQMGVFDRSGKLIDKTLWEGYPKSKKDFEERVVKIVTKKLANYPVTAPQVSNALPELTMLRRDLDTEVSNRKAADDALEGKIDSLKEEYDERYQQLTNEQAKLKELVVEYMSNPPIARGGGMGTLQLASLTSLLGGINFDTRDLSPSNGFVVISGTVFCAFTSFLVMSYVSLERKRDKKRQGRAREHEVDQAEENHKRMTITFWMGVIFAVAVFGLQYVIR